MNKISFLAGLILVLIVTGCVHAPIRSYAPATSQAPRVSNNICSIVAGATVIASDGKYLGKVINQYSSDSILNEYGSYGGEYSATSIWNQYGTYGGQYSNLSPFNQYTTTPPSLIKNGRVVGYITINQYAQGAINAYIIKSCTFY